MLQKYAKAIVEEYIKSEDNAEVSLKQLGEFYLEANGNYYYRSVCMYCGGYNCDCKEVSAGHTYHYIDDIGLYCCVLAAEFELDEDNELIPYIWEEVKKRGYVGKMTDQDFINETEAALLMNKMSE